MDGKRFDALTKSWTGSRRSALWALLAGAVGVAMTPPDETTGTRKGRRKRQARNTGQEHAAGARPGERQEAPSGQPTAVVCHKGREIEIAVPALQAHLDHGDELGPCDKSGAPVGERCRFNSDCWSGFCDRSDLTCQCPPERPRVCAETRTCCAACSSCPRPGTTICLRGTAGCRACQDPGGCAVEVETCCNTCPGRYCRTCVAIIDDPRNCGACGTVCDVAAGQDCCNGACRSVVADPFNCGACGTRCASGRTCGQVTCTCISSTECPSPCTCVAHVGSNEGACAGVGSCSQGALCTSDSDCPVRSICGLCGTEQRCMIPCVPA